MALSRVQIGSLEHIAPIVIAVLLFVFMLKLARTKKKAYNYKLIHSLACFISLFLVSFHLYHIVIGSYNYTEDLPLYMCSFMALIIPLFTYTKKFWLFEILLFWVISGTIQGVVTPDIALGFPSFDYFRYWLVHLGLLIIIGFYVNVFKYKPTFKSVIKSYIALQVYVVVMMLLNKLIGANYGYLNAKPKSASVIDLLGDWPYYILKADVILFLLFMAIYLAFKIPFKKVKALKS